MIISVHNKCPGTLPLFLITAASLFLPVLAQQSVVTIKETNSPLESRKLQYTFDPTSTLTSYTDQAACGPRGDDAQADLSQCIGGSVLVADVHFTNAADVPNIDGCRYYAYKIWECLPAPPTPSPIAASTPGSTPAPTGNGGGDPHFKTFNGKAFSYHGECDLVLMRSKSFEDGKGLSIHVRTTRMDNYRGAAYSYISAAAVQMGNTVLEVSADDGSLLVDGSSQAFANDPAEEGGADVVSFVAGYTLERSTKGKHGLITVFDLNLRNEKKISIRCNTKSMMLFVDVTGYFEDSEGLLGAPVGGSEGLGSRPNAAGHRFDMTGNWNSYGEEWQVLDTEPNLFQEKRFPQYPEGCVYESTSFKKNKRMLRRRLLLDSVDEAALEMDARKACAKSSGDDSIMNQFCFNDVMATGDLELAEDPFYHASSAAE